MADLIGLGGLFQPALALVDEGAQLLPVFLQPLDAAVDLGRLGVAGRHQLAAGLAEFVGARPARLQLVLQRLRPTRYIKKKGSLPSNPIPTLRPVWPYFERRPKPKLIQPHLVNFDKRFPEEPSFT